MKNIKYNSLALLTLIFGLIVSIMIFLPSITSSDASSAFLGYEVMFGSEFVNLGTFASGQIIWSPLAIIAYLAPLSAGLITVFTKKYALISFILFTVSAILLFTLPAYTKTTITIINTVTEIQVDWSLSYGLIISGVFAVFGSVICLYTLIYKKQ
ncbi:MAG: hypothetical protein RQ856_04455 [Candidatus Izemoplasmatales bacterium]|nr:hypothetical protein [Candidatus Izemoplasmatales bacterium]